MTATLPRHVTGEFCGRELEIIDAWIADHFPDLHREEWGIPAEVTRGFYVVGQAGSTSVSLGRHGGMNTVEVGRLGTIQLINESYDGERFHRLENALKRACEVVTAGKSSVS